MTHRTSACHISLTPTATFSGSTVSTMEATKTCNTCLLVTEFPRKLKVSKAGAQGSAARLVPRLGNRLTGASRDLGLFVGLGTLESRQRLES